MLETIQPAPADPILGLTEAFQADPNPEKINLSVGVYKDASGVTPILPSVKEAESRLLGDEKTKSYLGIAGAPAYASHVQALLFGAGHELIEAGRVATSHTPGGTGALRVAANFLHTSLPASKVWLSDPTWANHGKIFAAAGVETAKYPYFDPATGGLDWTAMRDAVAGIPAGDVLLLHGCCHNPTGVDPTPEQWEAIAGLVAERGLLPLVDFAYQGFATGIREDATPLGLLTGSGRELLICSSFSKNFGLYCERVGAFSFVSGDRATTDTVQSQVKAGIRANYSNPPAHGAAIVTTILDDDALRQQWEGELAGMRERIHAMRGRLAEALTARGVPGDWSFIVEQKGMFSFSGLMPEQVDRLRDEYSIYVVRSGRINVAGLTADNIDRVADAIAAVV